MNAINHPSSASDQLRLDHSTSMVIDQSRDDDTGEAEDVVMAGAHFMIVKDSGRC